jgi:ABC-type dipeptide/oligopeptide/nickel transport system ATPase component
MLTIENLSVEYYRRGRVIPAVREFSLSVEAGEIVGLVGESGSGKSTVALAIMRLIRPQEGRITAGKIHFSNSVPSPLVGEGEDGGDPPPSSSPTRGEETSIIDLLSIPENQMRSVRGARIAMIFQDPFSALNPVMRIREQMAEVLAAPTVLSDALRQVQLDPIRILNSYPHQLSGGQRQRVLIATALLARPQILLADEPTTALDVLVQKEILELLFKLQKELGLGILLISHNLALVAQHAQRIAVMSQGSIIEEGLSQQILSQPGQPYTQELLRSVPRLSL